MGVNNRAKACKFEAAFKSTHQHHTRNINNNNNMALSESGRANTSNPFRRISGGINTGKTAAAEEKLRRRAQEKAEILFHLICWGPR
ncbi:hypothetical protein LguiB_002971 [Lonicera macranthoides]